MDELSLLPPVQAEEPLSLNPPGIPQTPVAGTTATERARKYAFAMAQNNPGEPTIENNITTGREDDLRANAALQRESDEKIRRREELEKGARAGVTPEQARILQQRYLEPVRIDPAVVMEQSFADEYSNMIERLHRGPQLGSPEFNKAQGEAEANSATLNQIPLEDFKAMTGPFRKIITRTQIAQKEYEDLEARNNKMDMASYGVNFVGSMFPVINSIAKSETLWGAILPGSNMEAERDKFWSFDNPSEAKAWLQARIKTIEAWNPIVASEYAKGILSTSYEDKWVANVFSLGGATLTAGQLAAANVISKAAKSVADTGFNTELVRAAPGAKSDPSVLLNAVNALAGGSFRTENVAAALGDLSLSAEIVNGKRVLQRLDRNNLSQAIQNLPLLSNPRPIFTLNGSYMAEDRLLKMSTVIEQQGGVLMDGATKEPRIQRLEASAQTTMRQRTQERIMQEFPSVQDNVINAQLHYSSLNNAYYVELIIANRDGTYPRSPREVERLAKEMGLDYKAYNIVHDIDPISFNSTEDAISRLGSQTVDSKRMATARATQGTANSFTTAKGSTYQMNPDGTTTRNKAARPEHPGDSGPQAPSKKTVYIKPEDARALAPTEGQWRYADHNGQLSLITRTHEKPWGKSPSSSDIAYSTTPKEGLIPVEFWNGKKLQGQNTWGKVHFGNEITKVDTGLTRQIKMPSTQEELDKAIKKQGNRYFLSIIRPVDETDSVIRQLELPTTNTNPVSAANYWLGGLFRSADDQVAYFQRQGRHLATHTPNAVQRFMVETAQSIGQLNKESHHQLETILQANKAAITYDGNGKPIRGEAYRSQGALEREWRVRNGRLPTEQESLAYWTYHQLMDIDWALRNFAVHRDLARQGIGQLYTIRMPHTLEDGTTVESVTHPGKFVSELPMKSNSDFAVMIIDDGKPSLHIWKSEMAGNLDKQIQAMLKNGYQAIQVANPMDRPYKNATGKKESGHSVHFVITKELDTAPLPMNLVDRNPGVHIIYPQEHFVKEPIVETGRLGRRINYGDRTLLGADTEVEAKRLAKALSDFKNMVRNKATPAQLDDFVSKNLPETAEFWLGRIQRGEMNIDAPVLNTHSGKSTFDTHPELTKRPEYKDMFHERDTEFNGFRTVDMDFMADRDLPLMQVMNKGSIDKPMYVLEQARTVDPFAALNRALGNSIRHQFVNDYRTSAIEQWARQFAHLTDLGVKTAESNPFHVFYNGEIKATQGDSSGALEVQAAINTRARIKQFIGQQTEFGRDLDHVQTRLMNMIGEGKIARWFNDHELRGIKDPVAGLRALMYHYKFGLFNPKQFFVQAQGFTHVSGILIGAHGAVDGMDLAQKSFSAYMFKRALDRFDDPNVKNAIVNKAVAMGWKKEDFIAATRMLDNTGFGIIGRELSLRDGVMDPGLWSTTGGKVLDAGGGFFRAGERLVRETAFYAAFQEWRKANPTKKIDQFTPGEILVRADDLSLNMTKASHSGLQEGLWRLPTQFYTFSQRIMEQFWGGRLTPKEKLAAFSLHSMLYGIPAAAGAVIPLGVYDMIRKQALLDGQGEVDINNSYFKLATEGFVSWAFWHLTGKEYNFGQRFGPGFSDQLTKLFGGELSVMEAAGGAAGSFIESMAKSVYPFYAHMKAGLIGGQHSFPLFINDIMPMIKEVSSFSDVANTIIALNTQKYLSKAGNLLADDMSGMDAAAIMLGLTRRDITDARLIEFGVKDQEAHQRNMRNKATNDLKIAYEYLADGNMGKAEAYFARAKVYMVVFGDMREQEIVRTMTELHKTNEPLVRRAKERFLKDGYASQLPRRLQMLIQQGK
jgi:hypothetical protein